jgi:flagellar hook-associated protein 2
VLIDDGDLGLNLTEQVRGQDALLRVGADAQTGFVVSNSTNIFDSVVSGLTLTAKSVGTSPVNVTVARDADKLTDILKTFVKNYNDVVTQIADSTRFNAETNERGALQGEGIALRVSQALASLANGRGFGAAGSDVRSLRNLGITLQSDGKLNFDTAKFAEVAQSDPQAVSDFFLNDTTGFGAKLKATVESFTDSTTGKLTSAEDSAQTSVDNLEKRIADVQASIEAKKNRLLLQFTHMEQVLSQMNGQQSALEKLKSLSSSS